MPQNQNRTQAQNEALSTVKRFYDKQRIPPMYAFDILVKTANEKSWNEYRATDYYKREKIAAWKIILEILLRVQMIIFEHKDFEGEGSNSSSDFKLFGEKVIDLTKEGTKLSWWNNYNDEKNIYGIEGVTYEYIPVRPPSNHYFNSTVYFLPKKELTWFIFPSNLPHLPGKGIQNEKRYSLSADLYA